MQYIRYGLHFKITHSLFKRQSQMCSKMHQLYWKMNRIYVQDKLFINWSAIQKPCACFNRQKGKENSTFPILYKAFLSSSKPLKIGAKYFVFTNKTWGHMQIQPPVFNVWWFDTWLHHYIIILGYHKRKMKSVKNNLFPK